MSIQALKTPLSELDDDLEFYATCGSGLADLLAGECRQLGFSGVQTAGSGVRFRGSLAAAYTACLWSRIANRILLPIHRGPAADPDELYALAGTINWSEHLLQNGSLAVDFFTANSAITHSQYGALKVKDAIVDQFRAASGQRPDVDREQPDVRINVYLFRNNARIAIDLSGSSLHRRGYRVAGGFAPLKENLAAAVLLASGWAEAAQRGDAFYDPMCGSGTLLIEAAMIATCRAPGLYRQYFGFLGWQQHNPTLWAEILDDAKSRIRPSMALVVGADCDASIMKTCRENILEAGLSDAIQISLQAVDEGRPASLHDIDNGMIVTNPPYGERLQTDPAFYASLGSGFSRHFPGWTCALFTASAAPYSRLRLPLNISLKSRNGGIDCVLMLGHIPASRGRKPLADVAQSVAAKYDDADTLLPGRSPDTEHSELDHPQAMLYRKQSANAPVDATAFLNRLRKNQRTLKGWLKQNNIHAYRVYDADLPEFAVAIDIFHAAVTHCVVQEYQAPDTVNVAMAEARLNAVLQALPDALGLQPDCIHLKIRQVQPGKEQYGRSETTHSQIALVEEFGAQLEVNFTDYLDVGLFLDHRPVRRHLFQHSQNKKFLNLFAYTGSATVAAVMGGAASSISVDSSNRYCQWAQRNLDKNGAAAQVHEVVRQDVPDWLDSARTGLSQERYFDLILLDPPTFSNSSDQKDDWNLQRDHVVAIQNCLDILASDGLLIFSNNYRRFKLDEAGLCNGGRSIRIENRSRWSIDRDFRRNQRIHQCWFISKA